MKLMFKTPLKAWVLACALLLAGCATLPSIPPQQNDLSDLCNLYGIAWELDSVSQVITLRQRGLTAKALVGSDIVLMRREKIQLSMPLQRLGGVILVPDDFRCKVIDRFLKVSSGAVTRPLRVVIDAGHGGKDPGAISRSGVQEKAITLDIAQRLERVLKRRGFDVRMTRDRDEFVSLEKRTEIASSCQADLFISIHANADPGKRGRGVETYYCRWLNSQEKKEAQRVKNYRLFLDQTSIDKKSRPADEIVSDLMQRYTQEASASLASMITRKVSRDLKARNRGDKTAGYFVLRNTLIPAVLVEVGFLSHYREEKLLKRASYRQEIADSLAESLTGYASRI